MEDGKVVHFEAKKTDAEIAADLKRRIEETLIPVLAVMDEAISHGMMVQWDSMGPMPVKCRVGNLRIVKFF